MILYFSYHMMICTNQDFFFVDEWDMIPYSTISGCKWAAVKHLKLNLVHAEM